MVYLVLLLNLAA